MYLYLAFVPFSLPLKQFSINGCPVIMFRIFARTPFSKVSFILGFALYDLSMNQASEGKSLTWLQSRKSTSCVYPQLSGIFLVLHTAL